MAMKRPNVTFGESSLRPDAPPFVPQRSWEVVPLKSNTHREDGADKTMDSLKRGPPPETDEEAAKRLKLTVLAPFFERITQDGEENARLRQMNDELKKMKERHQRTIAELHEDSHQHLNQKLVLEAPEPRGVKRKQPPVSPMKLGSRENGEDEHTIDGHLVHIANRIAKDLEEIVPSETMHLCGWAPIKILETHPDEVLDMAHQKLHTWPYKSVPMCWRRLYEDAALSKAACLLREEAERIGGAISFKKRRLNVDAFDAQQLGAEWLTELVTTLDKGITLTGAPGRASVFEAVLQQLANHIHGDTKGDIPTTINLPRKWNFETEHPIARANKVMNFAAFQLFLDQNATPIIIPGVLVSWPAISLWRNPTYLMRVTLGGRRLVPVEVGKSYLDDDWSQRMMPFRDFMTDFLLPNEPKEVGYLAQHDLFAQIPTLRNDISIPDYCYTSPPDPVGPAAHTAGLASAQRLDEPLLNAWLGPKNTKTPLHTDPYHNILCQVVGYKYVRLYAPSETPKVYPCGADDNGIDMSNTSQVDVSRFRQASWDKNTDAADVRRAERPKFPLFGQAEFVEAVIGPGECLYIPLGWWHYVESLSTSFSVSFWWN